MKTKNLLTSVIICIVSIFLVATVVYATTIIGTNVSTGGTLDVTGLSTFTTVTSTSATSTNYIYVGPDGTENLFDFSGGDIYVADDAEIDSDLLVANKTTSTVALAVGSGTINNINMAGGDLYVQNDAEIDGGLWVDSASTTDTFYSGGNGNINGRLIVNGDSGSYYAYIGDDSNLWGGYFTDGTIEAYLAYNDGSNVWAVYTTGNQQVTGNATTTGDMAIGSDTTAATTTLRIKADGSGASGGGCIEIEGTDGTTYSIMVNGAGAISAVAGSCE